VSSRDLEQRERLQEQLLMPIEEMVGVTEKMAEKLKTIGVNTVQKLVKTPTEKLLELPGLGPKSLEKLMITAEGTVKELDNALEELIRKEDEEREKAKEQEKPLFDESVLEADEEPAAAEPELTAETLFTDTDTDAETDTDTDTEPDTETDTADTEDAASETEEAETTETPEPETVESAESQPEGVEVEQPEKGKDPAE
jgi:hypothetical protein